MADFFTLELVKTTVLPAAVAGAGSALSRCLPRWLQPLAAAGSLTVAYAAAHWWIAGDLQLRPREALHWLPLLTALGILLAMPGQGSRRSFPLWLIPAAAILWTLLVPLREYYEWSGVSLALWSAGTATGLLLLFGASCAGPPNTAPGALAVVAGGAAGAAILSHSAKVASLAAALGFALAAFAGAGFFRPRDRASWGATAAGSTALGALLLYALHYVDLEPRLAVALLGAGWGSLYLGALPAWRRLPPRKSLVLHTLLAALPVGAAVYLAFRVRDASPYY